MMLAWSWLVSSALLQVGWLVSLRALEGFRRLVPIVWYLAFGASSTWCLSRAILSIPLSTAYAVWTGLSVAGALALDRALGLQTLNGFRLVCIGLILAGTAGLYFATPPAR